MFAIKYKHSAPAASRSRLSRFGYRGPEVKTQQAEIRRILRSSGAQYKLTIGQPDDKYEQEADRVADQVMRMPDPKLQRQPENEEEEEMLQAKPLADQITPLVQRQEEPSEEEEEPVQAKSMLGRTPDIQRICPECEKETAQRQPMEEEEEELQPGYDQEPEESTPIMESVSTRDAGELGGEEEELLQPKSDTGDVPQVTSGIARDIQSIKGTGQPLPASERAFFEPRFGKDLSQVRVHNDSRAGLIARSINARAFTLGRDVVFGAGQYSPGVPAGRKLLAHELTHIIQQRAARSDSNNYIYRKTPKSRPSTLSRAQLNRLRRYWKRQTRILTVQHRRISSRKWEENYKKQLIYYIEQYEGLMKASKYLAKVMKNVNAVKMTIRALKLIGKIKGKIPKKYTPRVDVDITSALSYGPQILSVFLPISLQHSLDRAILMAYWNNDQVAADKLTELKTYGSLRYKVLLKRYSFRVSFYRKKLKQYIKYHHRETTQLRQLKRQIGFNVFEYIDKGYLEKFLRLSYIAGPIFNYPDVILKNRRVRPIDVSKPYN